MGVGRMERICLKGAASPGARRLPPSGRQAPIFLIFQRRWGVQTCVQISRFQQQIKKSFTYSVGGGGEAPVDQIWPMGQFCLTW